jgi:hypothetical protein
LGGGLQVQDQPGPHSKTLSKQAKHKTKHTNRKRYFRYTVDLFYMKIQTSRLLSIVVLGYEWGLTDPKK